MYHLHSINMYQWISFYFRYYIFNCRISICFLKNNFCFSYDVSYLLICFEHRYLLCTFEHNDITALKSVCSFNIWDILWLVSFNCLFSWSHFLDFFCMLSNFELYSEHCRWYVIETLNSVMFFWRIFTFSQAVNLAEFNLQLLFLLWWVASKIS